MSKINNLIGVFKEKLKSYYIPEIDVYYCSTEAEADEKRKKIIRSKIKYLEAIIDIDKPVEIK